MKTVISLFGWLVWASVALANEGIPAPQYFPDEYWVYDVVEVRTQRGGQGSDFQSGTYKMEVLEDGKLNLDPVFASKFPSIYEGPATHSNIEWYRFPIKIGTSYKMSWRGRNAWVYGTVTVVAKEMVTVPAGTFEAYKLVLEEDSSRTDARYEYWFAPAAKAAVKVVEKRGGSLRGGTIEERLLYTRTAELVSFKAVPTASR